MTREHCAGHGAGEKDWKRKIEAGPLALTTALSSQLTPESWLADPSGAGRPGGTAPGHRDQESQFAWDSPGFSTASPASCKLFSVLDKPDQRVTLARTRHDRSEHRGRQLSWGEARAGGLGFTVTQPTVQKCRRCCRVGFRQERRVWSRRRKHCDLGPYG